MHEQDIIWCIRLIQRSLDCKYLKVYRVKSEGWHVKRYVS